MRREKKKEKKIGRRELKRKSNRGLSVYQPNTLPLGQTGSHKEDGVSDEVLIIMVFVPRASDRARGGEGGGGGGGGGGGLWQLTRNKPGCDDSTFSDP